MGSEFVRVGKVKDAHGIKGELFIVLFAGEAAWIDKLKALRLTDEAGAVLRELEVKSARLHKNGLIVKTVELKDRNEAESLCGHLLEIPSEFFVSAAGEAIYLREVENFQVSVKGRGEIGKITGFASNGAQDLLIITTPQGEFEVPFVQAFVEKIDYAGKQMHLNLPFGLLGEEVEEESASDSDESDAE